MSYNIIPNIIFVIALVGVILIILRHLPRAASDEPVVPVLETSEQRLLDKGLPLQLASRFKTLLLFWGRRGWHFVLEAKGIKHQAQVGYRIKKMFKKAEQPSLQSAAKPKTTTPVITKDENYFLAEIKSDPKNLDNYSGLALLYTQAKNFGEARDLYEYLVKHDAGNADFHARLGYAHYLLDDFEKAVASYEKSLSLDAAHPNRYYNLGLAHRALNKLDAAKIAYKRALTLEPNNPNYREALEELKV